MKVRAGCFRFLVVILLLVCGAAGVAAEGMMVDAVVAVINGTSVTMSEVQQLAKAIMMANRPPAGAGSDSGMYFFKRALWDIIKQKLVLDEARKIGIMVLDREVEQAVERDVGKGEYKDLDQMLDELGVDKNTYFDKKRDRLLYIRAINAKLIPRIHVSPREISDYYDENIENYRQPEQIHLFGITFFKKADPSEDKKVLETAQQTLQKLRDGADFSEMAKQFSQDVEHGQKGGDWGWVDREGNVAAAAAFELSLNTVSDIIETNNSYWILKVAAKKQARTTPLRQVWEEIRANLRDLKFDQLHKEWLEELMKKADIVYPLEAGEQRSE